MVDISKKTVALLLILAIIISATTTLISLQGRAEGEMGGVTEDTKGAMVQVNVLPPPKGAQVQVEVVEKGDTNE